VTARADIDRKPFGFLLWLFMETVFRALADPTRRALLDALFARDGQTLVALTAGHNMTRIAVAKHLRLLGEAGLVISRRQGREKLHYLNPVPIHQIGERWIKKFERGKLTALSELKRRLEKRDA
jgi:DNA-binding transcriptional ArsR family regulator